MKQFFVIFSLLFVAANAFAAKSSTLISMKRSDVQIERDNARSEFSKISVENFETERNVGLPELPIKSFLVQGLPNAIEVDVRIKKQDLLPNLKPIPVQEQECRCASDKNRTFQYSERAYTQPQSPYKLTYIGAFRGTHISRLDIAMASYDFTKNQVALNTEVEVNHNAQEYVFTSEAYTDYLVIVPANLKAGVSEFENWKKSQGYTVQVEEVTSPTLPMISDLVKKHYSESGTDFVIIVGDSTTVPMFMVSTSGGQTPSDIKHFTMDGANDNVPDMFYSRIVANTADQVASQLNKAVEYEKRGNADLSGFKRVIGVASNEGSNPSDEEYVRSINNKFDSYLGTEQIHLAQNDSVKSNPKVLNDTFNQGSFWMTYLGHGSGTSWPSMNVTYAVKNIAEINNRDAVKPVVIDVACMNGVIKSTYLGASLMKTSVGANNTFPFGMTAYYGGTVNISWHPPAVMARGIAFEHLDKKFKHLGEALLAGQLYLAKNWNNQAEVIDNYEWYHLQGDPGMRIEF